MIAPCYRWYHHGHLSIVSCQSVRPSLILLPVFSIAVAIYARQIVIIMQNMIFPGWSVYSPRYARVRYRCLLYNNNNSCLLRVYFTSSIIVTDLIGNMSTYVNVGKYQVESQCEVYFKSLWNKHACTYQYFHVCRMLKWCRTWYLFHFAKSAERFNWWLHRLGNKTNWVI